MIGYSRYDMIDYMIDSLVARARVLRIIMTAGPIHHTSSSYAYTYLSQVEKQAAEMAALGNKLDQLLLGDHEQDSRYR